MFFFEVGDSKTTYKIISTANHVTKLENQINRVSANSMETRVSIGNFDHQKNRYKLLTNTQNVHGIRDQVAAMLNVPLSQVRVIAGDVGGALGIKGNIYHDQILVLWASKLLNRPVRWTADRTEYLMSDNHARDNLVTVKLGLDQGGKFLALRVDTIANLGTYLGSMTLHSATNNLGGSRAYTKHPKYTHRLQRFLQTPGQSVPIGGS